MEIPLTFAQLKHIKSASHMHYDYHCRSCGEVGGFIYGWWNQFWPHDQKSDDYVLHVIMCWREMDTLFKILEFCDDVNSTTIRNILRMAKMHMEEASKSWLKEVEL